MELMRYALGLICFGGAFGLGLALGIHILARAEEAEWEELGINFDTTTGSVPRIALDRFRVDRRPKGLDGKVIR